ncbi:MAG: hypothetical protein M1133_04305 [Armatimonadetes bacterium]|nr:hypothetical protein [Armatimonadota bacterium]
MRDLDRPLMLETEQEARVEEITEFPLPVAEDWDLVVRKSDKMADVIDRHLDFESKLQGRELRPNTLCPEQKVSLVSDLTVV